MRKDADPLVRERVEERLVEARNPLEESRAVLQMESKNREEMRR
jgi:hypothetical protein